VPDPRLDLARGDADPHADAGVLEKIGAVLGELVHRLPVGVDALPRVASRPADADADHGQLLVARRLQVVARENAEPARVDGEVLVEAELHAEVCDGPGHATAAL
jgi:hypothetical protein